MARGLFGRRRELPPALDASVWTQLSRPGAAPVEPRLDPPALAFMMSARAHEPQSPESELLEKITRARSAVADALYEASNDYRMLCDMTQAKLAECSAIIDELRGRLAGNLHFAVLEKLDEACALVEARTTADSPKADAT